ncbi:hypothetical protein [Streptomyces sp. NPDC047014]|uniref:hypothetical protein n=1 Tax=Streptomyces sp. NPDC047014 TaxID=3155736 RepID=UPI0033C9459E
MSRPRRKPPGNCDACGAITRRGKYRLCAAGCGARLHTERYGPCTDAHAPICPRYQPHAKAEETPVTYPDRLREAKSAALRAGADALAAQQDENPFEPTPDGHYSRPDAPYSEVEATLRAAGIHLNSRSL